MGVTRRSAGHSSGCHLLGFLCVYLSQTDDHCQEAKSQRSEKTLGENGHLPLTYTSESKGNTYGLHEITW